MTNKCPRCGAGTRDILIKRRVETAAVACTDLSCDWFEWVEPSYNDLRRQVADERELREQAEELGRVTSAEYAARLEKVERERDEARAACAAMISRFEHISEYWNGDINERAMLDALNEAGNECDEALSEPNPGQAILDRLSQMKHCDNCGGTWVDDGINTGCYCRRLATQEAIIGEVNDWRAAFKSTDPATKINAMARKYVEQDRRLVAYAAATEGLPELLEEAAARPTATAHCQTIAAKLRAAAAKVREARQ